MIEDITMRARTNFGDFFTVMDASLERFKKLNGRMREMRSSGGKLAHTVRNMTHGMKGFRMEMLGVMFFGMAIQHTFIGLLSPALEIVGAFDVMNTTLGVTFLPTALAVNDALLLLMNVFISLPEPIQQFLGVFALMMAGLGLLLSIIGQVALGFGALIIAINVFGASFATFLVFAGALVAIAAVVAGLIVLWQNWDKISAKLKVAIAAIGIALGVLALFFAPVIGWILLIGVAIMGIMAIIKNWGAITDWLKEKWGAALDWIIEKLNVFIRLYNKIAKVLRLPTIGEIPVSGSRQVGGYVPYDGLYRLHAGETVQQANNMNFSPTINVSGGGNAMDIANRIKMELNQTWAAELQRLARR